MGVDFKVEWHGDEFVSQKLIPAVDKGVGRASLVLSTRIAESMPGAGAAVIGKTETGRNIYRASNPGEAPGVRTNRLRGSITNEKVRQLVWTAGTNVGYAMGLEFGIGQPARPFIRPALERSKSRMVSEFVSTVRREMGNG